MKKSVKTYTLAIFILFAVFTSVYYLSYRSFSEKNNFELSETDNSTDNIQSETDALEANMEESVRISRRMTYISELYDSVNNTVTEAVETIPDEWIGLSREELVQKLSQNSTDMTLVSFSEDRFVVRQNKIAEESEYSYYLVVREGVLIVYYADMHDVFLNTYLTLDELPEDDREMLKNGFYVSDITELYDYLESITS